MRDILLNPHFFLIKKQDNNKKRFNACLKLFN